MNQLTKLLAIVAVLVFLGGGYLFWSSTANAPGQEQNTVAPTTKEFVLRIENKKIIGNATTLTVQQGDIVVLKITADETEEFHIHGYDQSVELEPGVEAMLSYTAAASGRFPFELEKSGTELGAIEVLP